MRRRSRDRPESAKNAYPFRELAEVFQKLERTSSSLTLVTILAEFLSRLNPDEAQAVAYLLRGELAPPFESLEIGMAERMVVRAVVDPYTVPQQRVERLLTTTGDLGTAAETLAAAERGRAASILYCLRRTAKHRSYCRQRLASLNTLRLPHPRKIENLRFNSAEICSNNRNNQAPPRNLGVDVNQIRRPPCRRHGAWPV
jgi:hypothetical protein